MTDTSNAPELLPCPFCGGEAKRHTCLGNVLQKGPPWYETKYRVSCSSSCSCSSKPCHTQDEADLDWNTRPAITPQQAAKVLLSCFTDPNENPLNVKKLFDAMTEDHKESMEVCGIHDWPSLLVSAFSAIAEQEGKT